MRCLAVFLWSIPPHRPHSYLTYGGPTPGGTPSITLAAPRGTPHSLRNNFAISMDGRGVSHNASTTCAHDMADSELWDSNTDCTTPRNTSGCKRRKTSNAGTPSSWGRTTRAPCDKDVFASFLVCNAKQLAKTPDLERTHTPGAPNLINTKMRTGLRDKTKRINQNVPETPKNQHLLNLCRGTSDSGWQGTGAALVALVAATRANLLRLRMPQTKLYFLLLDTIEKMQL